MQISGIPFAITDWSQIEQIEHKGESGMAYWRTREFGGIRACVCLSHRSIRAKIRGGCASFGSTNCVHSN
jgi:hypothetical protein